MRFHPNFRSNGCRERRLRRALTAVFALGFGLAAPAAADVGYLLEPLAKTGDTAPDTGGGTFVLFGAPALNASGDAIFAATVTGGTALGGIFRKSGGATTALMLQGDPAPGTASVFSSSINGYCLNDAGDVVFRAGLALPAGSGVFLIDGGGTSDIVIEGEPAPSVAGGTFTGFQAAGLNEDGDVSFLGLITGNAIVTEAIYRDDGGLGGPTLIVARGDAAPVTPAGFYDDLRVQPCSLNDFDAVAFGASLFGTTVPNGTFADDGPTEIAIAAPGDPAPTGGSYTSTPGSPFANRTGVVGYGAFVSIGGGLEGLFVWKSGVDSVVVLEGDPLPDTSGGTFSGSLTAQLANDEGIAARVLIAGGDVGQAIFHFSPSGTRRVVAAGSVATGIGGKFGHLVGPTVTDDGVVGFAGKLVGGPLDGGSAVYRAALAEMVPALAPLHAAILATCLAAAALWARRRRSTAT